MAKDVVKTMKGMKISLDKVSKADIISRENDWPHWFWWLFWIVLFFPMCALLLLYGLAIKKYHIGIVFKNGSTGAYDFDSNEYEKLAHYLNVSA